MDNIFKDIKAIIFDCDGVLVDSEYLSCNSLNIVFESEFGIDIGRDYKPIIGKPLKESMKYYLEKYNLGLEDINELMVKKEKAYQNQAKGILQTFENAKIFLDKVKSRNIKICVGSSGSLDKITFSLKEVGFSSYFDKKYITSSDEVENGKPAPDLFLLAAKKIQISPKNCVVVEDSINGAIGALKAGMKVIGFPGSFDKEDFTELGCYFAENRYKSLINLLDL